LHWLIREGYVIEFNDGSLDLPRPKAPAAPAEGKPAAPEQEPAPAAEAATKPERVEAESNSNAAEEVGEPGVSNPTATDQLETVTAQSEPTN